MNQLRCITTRWLICAYRLFCACWLINSPAGVLRADTVGDSEAAALVTEYTQHIKPCLQERCFACHGGLRQSASLRLDTVQAIRAGGDSGAVLDLNQAAASELLRRVRSDDSSQRMPPDGPPLTAQQIAALERWIDGGAPGPAGEQPEAAPSEHWAFRPPERSELPLEAAGEAQHPIDAWIAQALRQRGLQPQPRAAPDIRLRRLYLDLLGVPPTVAELQAFVRDPSDEAWRATVEKLLHDPRYGERWGRHWMDIWRYSDWYGRRHVPDVWNSAPQIWRWRDWIVDALNTDCGYDHMVQSMLAGDELAPADPEAGIATGYLIRNWYALNPNDWMRANVEHVGKAFLGLTFQCAHCHDHKYDPISQEDYFRLRAFFEPLYVRQDRVAGEADPGPFQDYVYSGPLRKVVRLGSVRVFDKDHAAPTWFYSGGDERNRDTSHGSFVPGVPDILAQAYVPPTPIQLPLEAWYPALREELMQTQLDEQEAVIKAAQGQLAATSPAALDRVRDLLEQVHQADSQLQQMLAATRSQGTAAAIAGEQSLMLEALTGRRVLAKSLPELTELPSQAVFSARLRLLTDSHWNVQLAKDLQQGLTAAYVAFDAGSIKAYAPGTFQEIEVGRYDFAAGERDFSLQLELDRQLDSCRLTVVCENNSRTLVSQVATALNGWDPTTHPAQGLFIDARSGCRALLDELLLESHGAGSKQTLLDIDFEPPLYPAEAEVAGRQGWFASPLGQAPATSPVTRHAGDEELRSLVQMLQSAQRQLEAEQSRQLIWQQEIEAARAQQNSLRLRMAAERAKYLEPPSGADAASVDEFQRSIEALRSHTREAASQAQRTAERLQAQAVELRRRIELAAAEALPTSDKERAAKVEQAAKAHTAATERLAQATSPTAASNDPTTADAEYASLGPTYPRTSTGRRLALAKWITHRSNPLAARVAVNHMWARHFHQPLVATVTDFGRSGASPSHPELLDWLAVEFMEQGWSMKHMHRLILTSQAWQRTSAVGSAGDAQASDPDNRWLWRMNTGRMEAEVVRDSLLYCSNRLELTQGGQELENDQALDTYRRSLYYSCNPENDGKSELGKLFDAPEPGDCYRRSQTVVPQQALALTNSSLVHGVAASLATELLSGLAVSDSRVSELTESGAALRGQAEACIQHAFLRILSRPPSAAELQLCLEALLPVAAVDQSPGTGEFQLAPEKLAVIVRALFNHNDFVTIR